MTPLSAKLQQHVCNLCSLALHHLLILLKTLCCMNYVMSSEKLTNIMSYACIFPWRSAAPSPQHSLMCIHVYHASLRRRRRKGGRRIPILSTWRRQGEEEGRKEKEGMVTSLSYILPGRKEWEGGRKKEGGQDRTGRKEDRQDWADTPVTLHSLLSCASDIHVHSIFVPLISVCSGEHRLCCVQHEGRRAEGFSAPLHPSHLFLPLTCLPASLCLFKIT